MSLPCYNHPYEEIIIKRTVVSYYPVFYTDRAHVDFLHKHQSLIFQWIRIWFRFFPLYRRFYSERENHLQRHLGPQRPCLLFSPGNRSIAWHEKWKNIPDICHADMFPCSFGLYNGPNRQIGGENKASEAPFCTAADLRAISLLYIFFRRWGRESHRRMVLCAGLFQPVPFCKIRVKRIANPDPSLSICLLAWYKFCLACIHPHQQCHIHLCRHRDHWNISDL